MTARNPEATAVVLETFQTYYAFSRAVNQGFHTLTSGAPASTRAAGSKRATCRSGWPRHHFQRAKAPGAFELVKDLVLEVPRFPLTCRRTLPPTSSPVARAATTRLHCLRCRLLLQDSKSIPHPQATVMPLADSFVIAEMEERHNPWHETLVQEFPQNAQRPHKHWRFSR